MFPPPLLMMTVLMAFYEPLVLLLFKIIEIHVIVLKHSDFLSIHENLLL